MPDQPSARRISTLILDGKMLDREGLLKLKKTKQPAAAGRFDGSGSIALPAGASCYCADFRYSGPFFCCHLPLPANCL